MYKSVSIFIISLSLLTSQLQAQHNHTESKLAFAQTETSSQTNAHFRAQLKQVFLASQQLKDALIASDVKKAQQAAGIVKKSLSQVDLNLLPGKPHTDWMNVEQKLKSNLDKIESESKLKAQRQSFASFSEALYKSIKTFGITEAYYQYCPMALEGEGAYWLSNSKQIKNPYLGDNMLTCGTTKEIIK